MPTQPCRPRPPFARLTSALLVPLLAAVVPGALRAADPVIKPYVSAGTTASVVVVGRVSKPGAASWVPRAPEGRDPLADNVAVFLTDEQEGFPVKVALQGRVVEARTDDDGFFRAEFGPGAELAPGPHPFTVRATGDDGIRASGRVLVVPQGPGRTIVTDFDDTVARSDVRDRRALLYNVFAKGPEEVEPVPGMATFLRCLKAGREGMGPERALVHYLSASPINLYDKITRYLALRRFPLGPLHLRDLDLRTVSDSRGHKIGTLVALAERFPEHRLVLVGDSGEADPEVYREIREKLGDRVEAIFIRKVDAGEDLDPGRFTGMHLVDDGFHALRVAVGLGLVHPLCLERPGGD